MHKSLALALRQITGIVIRRQIALVLENTGALARAVAVGAVQAHAQCAIAQRLGIVITKQTVQVQLATGVIQGALAIAKLLSARHAVQQIIVIVMIPLLVLMLAEYGAAIPQQDLEQHHSIQGIAAAQALPAQAIHAAQQAIGIVIIKQTARMQEPNGARQAVEVHHIAQIPALHAAAQAREIVTPRKHALALERNGAEHTAATLAQHVMRKAHGIAIIKPIALQKQARIGVGHGALQTPAQNAMRKTIGTAAMKQTAKMQAQTGARQEAVQLPVITALTLPAQLITVPILLYGIVITMQIAKAQAVNGALQLVGESLIAQIPALHAQRTPHGTVIQKKHAIQ